MNKPIPVGKSPQRESKPTRLPLLAPDRANAAALRQAARPVLRQVSPGRWVAEPGRPVPGYCLATVAPQADGTYTVAPLPEKMQRLNVKLLGALGLGAEMYDTLYRLARAGFIEIARLSPGTGLLNLDSYYNHLRRVSEDPDFWQAGKGNLEAYREALV